MARILHCYRKECGKGIAYPGHFPLVCPWCKEQTAWTASPLGPWPFTVTVNDQRFLRSLRSAVDYDVISPPSKPGSAKPE